MAPELMMRPANEKTDAFALGIVLSPGTEISYQISQKQIWKMFRGK
jgi:hypothetical protein